MSVDPPWAHLALRGEIDLATSDDWRDFVREASSPAVTSYVLDLQEVTFLDSAGLAILARMLRHSREMGGRVLVVQPQPLVMTVLQVSGLLGAIEMADGVSGHLRAASSPAHASRSS